MNISNPDVQLIAELETQNPIFKFTSITRPEVNNGDSITIVAHGGYSIEMLQEIVRRACNCWDGAPAGVKELHDLIIHGRTLQQYNTRVGVLDNQGTMIPPATGIQGLGS